jgi:hypothetical protein
MPLTQFELGLAFVDFAAAERLDDALRLRAGKLEENRKYHVLCGIHSWDGS